MGCAELPEPPPEPPGPSPPARTRRTCPGHHGNPVTFAHTTSPRDQAGGGAAASSPAASELAQVTHAITLKGARLSWAILEGHKTIENRTIRLRPGWYVLHTGKGKDTLQRPQLDALHGPAEASLPHGAVVGAPHREAGHQRRRERRNVAAGRRWIGAVPRDEPGALLPGR